MKEYKIIPINQGHSVTNKREYIIPICEYYSSNENIFTWPCAEVLSMYILNNKQKFVGKHVLELGCGTALPSIALAKYCEVSSIIATERPEAKASTHMYSIIHHNLLINGLHNCSTSTPTPVATITATHILDSNPNPVTQNENENENVLVGVMAHPFKKQRITITPTSESGSGSGSESEWNNIFVVSGVTLC